MSTIQTFLKIFHNVEMLFNRGADKLICDLFFPELKTWIRSIIIKNVKCYAQNIKYYTDKENGYMKRKQNSL